MSSATDPPDRDTDPDPAVDPPDLVDLVDDEGGTDPADPTDLACAGEPVSAAEPTQPAEPAEPAEPRPAAKSVRPVEPFAPTQPVDPVGSRQAARSARSTEAAEPAPTISLVPLSDGGPVVIDRPITEFEPRPASVQPYRPDSVIDGWSTDFLTVRGASVRGYAHRYKGVTRQDDLAVAVDEGGGRLVIAVADGVSSAEKSHLGSTVVCRFVVDWLLRQPTGEPVDWTKLVESAAWALVEYGGATLGTKDPAEVERVLATTLVAAVVSAPPTVDHEDSDPDEADDGRAGEAAIEVDRDPDDDSGDRLRVEVVQVGDSSAWLLSEAGYRRLVGGKDGSDDDEAVLSSLVSGLPRLPPQVEPVEVALGPGEVLLLGTDGFGDPLGKGTGLVGELFADHLLSAEGPPSPLRFAHLLDFSRETFDDDRTLVAVWRRPWITSRTN